LLFPGFNFPSAFMYQTRRGLDMYEDDAMIQVLAPTVEAWEGSHDANSGHLLE
jgi:hypothetical protein